MKNDALPTKTWNRPAEEIDQIHNPFQPAEVYGGEKIDAELELTSENKPKKIKLPVWRISPLGVELLVANKQTGILEEAAPGSPINLTIRMGDQNCEFKGLVIASNHMQDGQALIGI